MHFWMKNYAQTTATGIYRGDPNGEWLFLLAVPSIEQGRRTSSKFNSIFRQLKARSISTRESRPEISNY